MPPLQHVRPGDLITAEFMNQIVDELISLRDNIGAGGGAGPKGVTISRFHPSASTRVGDELTIFGSGFGSASRNIVTIGGEIITNLVGGVDRLTLTVPPLQGLGTGKVVTVTVGNVDGTAVATDALLVLPFQATRPEGDLRLTLSGNPGLTLNTGTPVDYVFDLKLLSNMDEIYALTTSITGTGWTAAITSPSSGTIPIPRSDPPSGNTEHITVRVTPGSAATATFKLTAKSQRNPNFGNSIELGLRLGTTGPPQQDQIAVTFGNSTGPGGRIAADSVPEIPNNAFVLLFFNVDIPATGAANDSYQLDLPIAFTKPDDSPATGWATGQIVPSGQFPLSRNGHRELKIEVKGDNQTTTPPEVKMTIKVRSTTRGTAVGEITQRVRRF